MASKKAILPWRWCEKVAAMLIAHKAIEAIRAGRFLTPENKNQIGAVVAEDIKTAEKFDFGELMLEQIPRNPPEWRVPQLTQPEMIMWREGLLPLPAPFVWYEFDIGGYRSATMIIESGNAWNFMRFDWDRAANQIVWDGIIAKSLICEPERLNGSFGVTLLRGARNLEKFEKLSDVYNSHHIVSNCHLALYLTLMLHSRTTEKAREAAPPKLNKQRLKGGKGPLFDHTVVTIVPPRFLDASKAEGISEHRSPRLHWRRSHVRHFDHQTPNSRQLPDGRWGIAIARMLVGKAELGEVSHEYRIR